MRYLIAAPDSLPLAAAQESNQCRREREVFMSSDGRIGAELGPIIGQSSGQVRFANTVGSGEANVGGAGTASAPMNLGIVQCFAIGLFMFGFPAALFGMFFANSYSWAFWAVLGVASLVVPPLLISVMHSGGRAGKPRAESN
ncbi:MAG: hypothetical protein ACRECV_14680 [Xanthobacteraceae bacterium]